MNTEVKKLMHQFWSSFGVPAFINNNVPPLDDNGNEIEMPYITYSTTYSDWGTEDLNQITVWTRSDSFKPLGDICSKIHDAIPTGGRALIFPDGSGCVLVMRGTPFMQTLPTEPPDIKAEYINVITRSYII